MTPKFSFIVSLPTVLCLFIEKIEMDVGYIPPGCIVLSYLYIVGLN